MLLVSQVMAARNEVDSILLNDHIFDKITMVLHRHDRKAESLDLNLAAFNVFVFYCVSDDVYEYEKY